MSHRKNNMKKCRKKERSREKERREKKSGRTRRIKLRKEYNKEINIMKRKARHLNDDRVLLLGTAAKNWGEKIISDDKKKRRMNE